MDKNQAVEQLIEFKNEHLLSREKCLEIYSFFKFNSDKKDYTCLVHNAPVKINRAEFWDVVNTSMIRNVFKRPKEQSEIEIEDNEATPTDYTKLRKECITAKNKLNFERNLFNKKLKEISCIEELNKEIISKLNKLKPYSVDISRVNLDNTTNDVLVACLSDIHGGEISNEFRDTGFDFNILSKRLQKYAEYIKREIVTKGYKKVAILSAGDLVNNVTLMSKRLMQTSNRAVTIVMMLILLEKFILDIYYTCPNIVFGGICSNEDRNDPEYFEDEYLITNCANYTIYNILEILFRDFKTITFLQGRNCEKVVNINGKNILLTHGVSLSKGDVEKGVQQIMSRYAVKGVQIDFVLFGHLHCQRNSSYFARSGSLCGSNAYSNSTLNLQTKASQSMIVVSETGDIHTIGVDLESVNGFDGYDISDESEKFALKERDKRAGLDLIQYV